MVNKINSILWYHTDDFSLLKFVKEGIEPNLNVHIGGGVHNMYEGQQAW